MRRRVWCETLSFAELCAPGVVALLARFQLDVLVAVRPWHLAEIAGVHARLRGAGVTVALWPMLDDASGRWASARSMEAFVALVDALLAAVPDAGEVVVDLEPAIVDVMRWKAWRPGRWAAAAAAAAQRDRGAPRPPPPDRYAVARALLSSAMARWRHGAEEPGERAPRRVSTAVMPVVPFDGPGQWMQRALGTPADGLPVQQHSVMAYTSLLEGWSRGLVGRRRAEWLLGWCVRRTHARWGALGGVSLGAVGTGAFGDEPTLRAPAELARDVAITRAAGIDEISLFDLGGVLRRPPPEAWLEALWGDSLPAAR